MRERTNDVEIERDVKVTMPDGVVLLTDVYHPVGVDDAPTLLERTPYGRAGIPAGEGAGFAGGIVSAALDGLRVAKHARAKLAGEVIPPEKASTFTGPEY